MDGDRQAYATEPPRDIADFGAGGTQSDERFAFDKVPSTVAALRWELLPRGGVLRRALKLSSEPRRRTVTSTPDEFNRSGDACEDVSTDGA